MNLLLKGRIFAFFLDTGVDYVSPKDVVDSIESSPSLESPNLEKVDLFQVNSKLLQNSCCTYRIIIVVVLLG